MKFVETYLKKNQFKSCPHKFTAAMLLSPIHLAECHYRKKYHLQFDHARKLFLFDMLLLLSVVTIGGAGLFWWLYNPTITDLVYLSITPSQERILSGEHISFDVQYRNESDVALHDVTLNVTMPTGFQFDTTDTIIDGHTAMFHLPNVSPHEENGLTISGHIYATPHEDNYVTATLDYHQAHRENHENKTSPHITIVRGSVLKTSVDAPEKIIPAQSFPLTISLTNDGDIAITSIALPLTAPNLTITSQKPSRGYIKNNIWYIDTLASGDTIQLPTQTILHEQQTTSYDLILRPSVTINEETFDQEELRRTFTIVHPHASISASWQDTLTAIAPSGIATLQISVLNDGETALEQNTLLLDIPPTIVNTIATKSATQARLTNATLSIPLHNLAIGDKQDLSLPIHIAYAPTGDEDITLSLMPTLQANVSDVPNARYETSRHVDALKIGTQVLAESEIRYYTAEGDQLGRGPLPPQVGEETKYWAFFRIQNTTSHIENVSFTASLPTYVQYTGKSSVTHGQGITYNTTNNTLTWQTTYLPAHTIAGIYAELSITPTEAQINTAPVILSGTTITAFDSYINTSLTRTLSARDIGLPTDTRAQARGPMLIVP